MLDFQKVVATIKEYGAVDFDCELDDGVMWFRGVNCYYVVGNLKDDKLILTVWEDDDCDEVVENFEIQDLDELKVCLDKYALIAHDRAQASTEQNEPNEEQTDITMIDIYFKLIKEKLVKQQISLDFEQQSPAERLVVRRIENELVKIIDFLR